jgi:hypothetical protein
MSLQFSQFRESVIGGQAEEVTISGTGLLHSIWLYRSHDELGVHLKQVEDPTDINLRAAGMVSTQLAGRREEHPQDEDADGFLRRLGPNGRQYFRDEIPLIDVHEGSRDRTQNSRPGVKSTHWERALA